MTTPGSAVRFSFLLVADRPPSNPDDTLANGTSGSEDSLAAQGACLERELRTVGGAWIGRQEPTPPSPEPVDTGAVPRIPVLLAEVDERSYQHFADATLWPLYHDVIVAPEFHRRWWDGYVAVNQRFADTTVRHAGHGATVWVHDYHLQLVPVMLRRARPDLRIGYFHHVPFPGLEIFAQLPWRRPIVTGLLGADLVGFQRGADTANFLRACRRAAGLRTRGNVVSMVERPGQDSSTPGRVSPPGAERPQGDGRDVRIGTFPVSVDGSAIDRLARSGTVQTRAGQIRAELGNPQIMFLAVDRLDYTKGVLHRLKAYAELLDSGQLAPPRAALLQVTRPSREQVQDYRILREDVEREISRINGTHATLGQLAVHHLHRWRSREEMIALYRAADVMLVTPLRDGMNLVAKEYVASRYDETGALVLSEFTGAADELGSAFLVNPHDIDGLKSRILQASQASAAEARRRMRSMRKRVRTHDADQWVSSFLETLRSLEPPQPPATAGQRTMSPPKTDGIPI